MFSNGLGLEGLFNGLWPTDWEALIYSMTGETTNLTWNLKFRPRMSLGKLNHFQAAVSNIALKTRMIKDWCPPGPLHAHNFCCPHHLTSFPPPCWPSRLGTVHFIFRHKHPDKVPSIAPSLQSLPPVSHRNVLLSLSAPNLLGYSEVGPAVTKTGAEGPQSSS